MWNEKRFGEKTCEKRNGSCFTSGCEITKRNKQRNGAHPTCDILMAKFSFSALNVYMLWWDVSRWVFWHLYKYIAHCNIAVFCRLTYINKSKCHQRTCSFLRRVLYSICLALYNVSLNETSWKVTLNGLSLKGKILDCSLMNGTFLYVTDLTWPG
jgi:hypothetical protein